MNAVVARGSDRFNTAAVLVPRVATGLALMLAGFSTWAFESDTSLLAAAAALDEAQRPRLEVSASTLPRFDSTDGANRSSRIDMTWLPPRRSALGLSLGMTSVNGPRAFQAVGGHVGAPNSVDLGLHWRYTLDGNYRIDVTAWRRLVPPDALTLIQMHQPSYGARVEMQIRPVPKSGFVADRGFIGLQLESGARVTLRRSGGKPMIYYRTKF